MLKKEYKELKNKIGEYFEKKELYTWEYEELSTLINKIKFDNPLLFEHYMGKLEYIKKSYIYITNKIRKGRGQCQRIIRSKTMTLEIPVVPRQD